MSKHKTKEKWIQLFKKYESDKWNWEKYYKNEVSFSTKKSKAKGKWSKYNYKLNEARKRFRKKYRQWKLLDNLFMAKKNENRCRKKKYDIDEVVSNLADKELRDIAKRYLEIKKKKDKKKEANSFTWSISRKAYVFGLHRTTFYKKPKKRIYKFDVYKDDIINIFNENKFRYGSGRLSKSLYKKGIIISDRTIRNYMNRWNLKCITRIAKRLGEKKYKIFVPDLVQRDFHGKKINAKATDVSYIPANEAQNFVYLSATIDHKTKYVHWSMSKFNDMKLIMDTQKQINEKDYVLHSDHAWQYFQPQLLNFNKYMNIKSSMKETNNPLDNREIEYFFGCLKSECLHHEKTNKMKFSEIKQLVSEYINWYNIKRIQKRLHWNAPAEASAKQSNV